ncbi:hypothetical protein DPMN_160680 [Dreissena polymorpha]|uniref:Potassium channel tetramerisation-type BTB domain-containing protein n=1 Tax=Dreissena polymorpha TaxID=45954 RepID=A0A9D4EN99_DREPO|nr:hypothetical protein DPMN_160680 [Dreissena polymorpha]
MLAAMFSGRHVINQDKDGRYVIDCDGNIFCHILEFLRFKTLPPVDVAEAVFKYSEYFQLNEFSELLCKFQPINRLMNISKMKERSWKYDDFSNTVIEHLSACIANKNDNVLITVARGNIHRNERNERIFYVRQELQEKISPLACTHVCISYFDQTLEWQKDELLFMAADQLRILGYGSNIVYIVGGDYSPSLILICNDNALSKLHTIPDVKFKSALSQHPW